MDSPRVSIIMPVHNSEKYLGQCIQSIIEQTEQSFELICIDDGSSDSSPQILDEFARQDDRIQVIHQRGMGAGAARNVGLPMARGTYLSFLDSDDLFDKNLLKCAADKMDEIEADIAVYESWVYDTTRQADRLATWYLRWPHVPSEQPFSYLDAPNHIFLSFGNCVWNKLFRRSFVERHDLHFQEISRWNDLFFSCASLVLANRICTIHRPLIHYRIETGTSLQSTNDRDPLAFYEASTALRSFLISHGLYNSLEYSYLNHLVDSIVYTADSLHTIDALEELKRLVVGEIEPFFNILGSKQGVVEDAKQLEQYRDFCTLDITHYLQRRTAALRRDRNDLYWLNDWRQWRMTQLESQLSEMQSLKTSLDEAWREIDRYRDSASYKLGYFLLAPVHAIRKLISK